MAQPRFLRKRYSQLNRRGREPQMLVLAQILNGVLLGGVYALFAVGLTLLLGIVGVFDVAHGASSRSWRSQERRLLRPQESGCRSCVFSVARSVPDSALLWRSSRFARSDFEGSGSATRKSARDPH